MQELGITGVQIDGFNPLGTYNHYEFGCSANLLKGLGKPESPDQVRVANPGCLRIDSGWCELATVMDLFSWRTVG
jgi:hypothetical protein